MTRETRLRIAETNWGRDCGWFVEAGGQRLAVLTDCAWDSIAQFWFVYRVTPLTDDSGVRQMLSTEEFWQRRDVTCRNREFDAVISQVVAVPQSDSHVRVRFLNLSATLSPLDKIFLWFRKRRLRLTTYTGR